MIGVEERLARLGRRSSWRKLEVLQDGNMDDHLKEDNTWDKVLVSFPCLILVKRPPDFRSLESRGGPSCFRPEAALLLLLFM